MATEAPVIRKTIEWKCAECEYITNSFASMEVHQETRHGFNLTDCRRTKYSQLSSGLRIVESSHYGWRVWETKCYPAGEESQQRKGNLHSDMLMPFGKHRGKKLKEVPIDYLFWVYTNMEKKDWNRGVLVYIKKNLERLQKKLPGKWERPAA